MKYIKVATGSFDELSGEMQATAINNNRWINVQYGSHWGGGESQTLKRAERGLAIRGLNVDIDCVLNDKTPVVLGYALTGDVDFARLFRKLFTHEDIIRLLLSAVEQGAIRCESGKLDSFTKGFPFTRDEEAIIKSAVVQINVYIQQVLDNLRGSLTIEYNYLVSDGAVVETLVNEDYQFYLATGEVYLGEGEEC